MDILDDLLNSFDELCDLIRNFSSSSYDFVSELIFGGKVRHTSIEKQTKDLTAIFPNIVDRTLSLRNVEKINRAIEIKNSNLLRLLLTSLGKQNMGKTSSDILRKFHRNFDKFDFIDYELSESLNDFSNLKSNYTLEQFTDKPFINEVSLNNRYYTFRNNNIIENTFNENKGRRSSGSIINKDINGDNIGGDNVEGDIGIFSKSNDTINFNTSNISNNDYRTSKGNESSKFADKDVKFLNNLSPTMIEVGVPTSEEGDTRAVIISMLFGVKSKIYPTTSDDIINAVSANMSSKLFKFIQMSTGEIKFFKDFIFNIDHVKNTVADKYDKSSNSGIRKLWKILRKRGKNQKRTLRINSMDNASIATLTINKSTVDEIYRLKSIDLMNPKIASDFMAKNNLMNLVVVDEITELCYIMSDSGDETFTEITFGFLDKELDDLLNQKTIKRSVSIFG
mgnify:CR=1 FL=1